MRVFRHLFFFSSPLFFVFSDFDDCVISSHMSFEPLLMSPFSEETRDQSHLFDDPEVPPYLLGSPLKSSCIS